MTALYWLGFAAGVLVLLGTATSVVGTLVMPRGIDSRMSRFCERAVDLAFVVATWRVRDFTRRDRILAWQAPVVLLLRLALWMCLLVLGYALLLVPAVSGSLAHALSEAGSSMFTLGYAAPTNTGTATIDYIAAYTGLVVIGLQVGYLPTFYAAFNRRETLVTLLTSRAGVPAWGPEILARTQWGIYDSDTAAALGELFDDWERWSAAVAESHTTYLILVRLRSPRPLSHWLISVLAVMDAAALHLSLSPGHEPKQSARLCLRMGFVALNQIARTMGLPTREDADPDTPISISYQEFAAAVDLLRAVNYPVERPAEQAWPDFRGWRVNYDTTVLALARALDAPPALWSGTRRWPATPMPPLRPSNRLPHDVSPPRPTGPTG
jgi:hypothetical protein